MGFTDAIDRLLHIADVSAHPRLIRSELEHRVERRLLVHDGALDVRACPPVLLEQGAWVRCIQPLQSHRELVAEPAGPPGQATPPGVDMSAS